MSPRRSDSDEVTEFDAVDADTEDQSPSANGQSAGGSGHGAIHRLYHGETHFDFVGRRRLWFAISAVIIIAGLVSLGFRGLNLGIDFKGGSSWEVLAPGVTQTQATDAMTAAGLTNPTVEILGGKTLEVQADLNSLPESEQKTIKQNVYVAMGRLGHTGTVSVTDVGPTWGSEVTKRAVVALIAFLVLVVIYISFRFEPKMALAAFIAMIHDLLITIGIYSLTGFQVTPDTVVAVLTILGYSLYDTVVVFDRVRDNTRGIGASGRMTYSEMVNLSMNQTLARSINTSLVAIIPVLAVLVVGAQLLGATTLQDYGLALFVGLLSGAYSSIFIAAPILAWMKEREPRYQAMRQRIESRRDRTGLLTPAAAAALTATAASSGSGRSGSSRSSSRSGPIKPAGASRQSKTRTVVATTAPDAVPTVGDSAKAAATGNTTRRPPPRPRKGGPKGKGKKRR
jgi:preprotein translocase subunit SecF